MHIFEFEKSSERLSLLLQIAIIFDILSLKSNSREQNVLFL